MTEDEAIINDLDLNYKVVYAGSEAALIEAFRKAEQNKTPLIGYFYSPQWFLNEVPLVKINLPPWKEGCDYDARDLCRRSPATTRRTRPEQDHQQEVLETTAPTAASSSRTSSGPPPTRTPSSNHITNEKMTREDAAQEVGRRQRGDLEGVDPRLLDPG